MLPSSLYVSVPVSWHWWVDAMVWDSAVKVDRDTAVMQEFIRVLLPLAPHVTTGINNIRKQINNLLCKSR